jgi:hypothetical protein
LLILVVVPGADAVPAAVGVGIYYLLVLQLLLLLRAGLSSIGQPGECAAAPGSTDLAEPVRAGGPEAAPQRQFLRFLVSRYRQVVFHRWLVSL